MKLIRKMLHLFMSILPYISGVKRFTRNRELTSRTEQKYAKEIWKKDGGTVLIRLKSESLYRKRIMLRWKCDAVRQKFHPMGM